MDIPSSYIHESAWDNLPIDVRSERDLVSGNFKQLYSNVCITSDTLFTFVLIYCV